MLIEVELRTTAVLTQMNHFVSALWVFVKLELLKSTISLNHFALKTELYVTALPLLH